MKLTIILILLICIAPMSHAQSISLEGVTIFDKNGQDWSGNNTRLLEGTKSGNNIPSGLNNAVNSILLARGWKVVIAENNDGSGQSETYVALNDELRADLPSGLKNKASYFQVIKLIGLRVYVGNNQSGTKVELKAGVHQYILNDQIKSIKVSKGFMVTLSENPNGSGMSKNYIARTQVYNVNLPAELKEKVSFIRVIPWRDTKKKGIAQTAGNNGGQLTIDTDAAWWYNWAPNQNSQLKYEWVPLQDWNPTNTNMDALRNKKFISHLNTFNEPDNHVQDNPMNESTAIAFHSKFLRTGLRIGSPAVEEGEWKKWLCHYLDGLQDQDSKRIDYINIHWYDWGGNGWDKNNPTPNEDPNHVFDRFKQYVKGVYNTYGLPIWITEFNANPNRNPWVQKIFLEKAMAWLETYPHVERYSYFICPNNCAMVDGQGNLTNIGQAVADQTSTLSIPEATWATPTISIPTCIGSPAGRFGSTADEIIDPAAQNIYVSNPISDHLTVFGLEEDTNLTILNVNGQVILSSYGTSLNVSGIPQGIYFLRVRGELMRLIK